MSRPTILSGFSCFAASNAKSAVPVAISKTTFGDFDFNCAMACFRHIVSIPSESALFKKSYLRTFVQSVAFCYPRFLCTELLFLNPIKYFKYFAKIAENWANAYFILNLFLT